MSMCGGGLMYPLRRRAVVRIIYLNFNGGLGNAEY